MEGALSRHRDPRTASADGRKHGQESLTRLRTRRGDARQTTSKPAEHKMSEATTADEQLRLFIERSERLEEEKKGIADDIRDVYNESKSQGYDPKIMRQIVRLRKMPVHDRKEMEAILDVYKSALGLE